MFYDKADLGSCGFQGYQVSQVLIRFWLTRTGRCGLMKFKYLIG